MDARSAGVLREAMGHLQAGRLTEAKTRLNTLRMQYPKHADVEHLLAMAAKTEGDFDSAQQHFSNSLEASPTQPAVLSNLGNLYQEMGEMQKAEQVYQKAVGLDAGMLNAWRNLALVCCRSGKHAEAKKAASMVLKLDKDQTRSLELYSYILAQAGDIEGAKKLFEDILAGSPNDGKLWFSYASFLRAEADFAGAAKAYENAKKAGGQTPELYINLAEAYYENRQSQQALQTYDEALQAFPFDAQVHYANAKFRWEANPDEDHLTTLKAAIPKQPNNIGLWGRYFDLLAHEGRFEDVLKGLSEAYRFGIHAPRLTLAEAVAQSALGEIEEANRLFEHLTQDGGLGNASKLTYIEHLLKVDNASKAAQLCQSVLDEDPMNIRAWAFIGTAWQILEDERAHWLLDYENMVRTVEILPPEQYVDQASFFTDVEKELEALHRMQVHPIDQTVQEGTQTNGHLFRLKIPIIQQLKVQIKQAVEQTIAEFPADTTHPFWRHKTNKIDFSGAWSVRLRSQGYHTNHYHPEGWISSALYISLPKEVKASEGVGGHIQFGQPVAEMGLDLEPARTIKPKVGNLVLFPSYMWHGTIPFKSDEPRITVAFDIVPVTH